MLLVRESGCCSRLASRALPSSVEVAGPSVYTLSTASGVPQGFQRSSSTCCVDVTRSVRSYGTWSPRALHRATLRNTLLALRMGWMDVTVGRPETWGMNEPRAIQPVVRGARGCTGFAMDTQGSEDLSPLVGNQSSSPEGADMQAHDIGNPYEFGVRPPQGVLAA